MIKIFYPGVRTDLMDIPNSVFYLYSLTSVFSFGISVPFMPAGSAGLLQGGVGGWKES